METKFLLKTKYLDKIHLYAVLVVIYTFINVMKMMKIKNDSCFLEITLQYITNNKKIISYKLMRQNLYIYNIFI